MADRVPRLVDLADAYDDAPAAAARLAALRARFEGAHGGGGGGSDAAPIVVARAPGRVNLIGEHIDYEGYSVLPMAIAQDTVVLARANATSGMLRLANVDERYADAEFPADPQQEVDRTAHSWANYFLCGYKVRTIRRSRLARGPASAAGVPMAIRPLTETAESVPRARVSRARRRGCSNTLQRPGTTCPGPRGWTSRCTAACPRAPECRRAARLLLRALSQ